VSSVPLIAIVDDDVSMRAAISLVLQLHGLRTQSFVSAEAFLDAATDRETACIVVDVRLPGIDGLELQDRLSRVPDSPPVIVISAHADDRAKARALGAGAVAFLPKPFTEDQLVETIDVALRR
jgi:two-component system, LuxR family, response regulator FixJ